MSVAENIKQRRCELKMSQQELADAMGYRTRSTIAKIESGENDISQKKLIKFATVLNTTVEHLINGYSNPTRTALPVDFSATNRAKNVAIILAGGKTDNNFESIPTQFVSVHGKPIIVYSMEAYQEHPAIDDIFVVCTKGWESIVKAYAGKYGITKLKGLILAGETGVTSLKNAIDYINKEYSPSDYIVIQEATRPRVSIESISNLLQACYGQGSATFCYSMREYVQFDLSGDKAEYVDRNAMIALQSPEAHLLSLINDVFEKAFQNRHLLTESCCTMLMYNLGYHINFIRSSVNNNKIASAEDYAAFGAWGREIT